MAFLLMDEPEDMFSADAWRVWRAEVEALDDGVVNKAELLALADRWLADLDLSASAGPVDAGTPGAGETGRGDEETAS